MKLHHLLESADRSAPKKYKHVELLSDPRDSLADGQRLSKEHSGLAELLFKKHHFEAGLGSKWHENGDADAAFLVFEKVQSEIHALEIKAKKMDADDIDAEADDVLEAVNDLYDRFSDLGLSYDQFWGDLSPRAFKRDLVALLKKASKEDHPSSHIFKKVNHVTSYLLRSRDDMENLLTTTFKRYDNDGDVEQIIQAVEDQMTTRIPGCLVVLQEDDTAKYPMLIIIGPDWEVLCTNLREPRPYFMSEDTLEYVLGRKVFADFSNAVGGYHDTTAAKQSHGIYTDSAIQSIIVQYVMKYKDVRDAINNGTGNQEFKDAYDKFKAQYGDFMEGEDLPNRAKCVATVRYNAKQEKVREAILNINSKLAMLKLKLNTK